MKKILKLRLIDSNESPKIGDIVRERINCHEYIRIIKEFHGNALVHSTAKVIKPIAISDEEIGKGDDYLLIPESQIKHAREDMYVHRDWKKIELLPEHFSSDILQLIVEGKLVDGSEIEVEYSFVNSKVVYLDSNGKAIISISKQEYVDDRYNRMSKPYREELGKQLVYGEDAMFENMQYYMEYCQSNSYITPQEWLKNHKHF